MWSVSTKKNPFSYCLQDEKQTGLKAYYYQTVSKTQCMGWQMGMAVQVENVLLAG